MIVIAVGLTALSLALAGLVVLQGKWLHDAGKEATAYADNIDGQRKLVAEYKSKYETEFVAHGVTTRELEQERQLRGVAEAQRNEAQSRCRAYLAQSMTHATKDDVNAVLADLFAAPLSVVPPPKARLSDSGDTALIDPGSGV